MTSGYLGKLEGLYQKMQNRFSGVPNYGLVIFAGDNGISSEQFSSYAPMQSADIVRNHLDGTAPTAALLKRIGKEEFIIDAGLSTAINDSRIFERNIRRGSRNFLHQDALEKNEAAKAVEIGSLFWNELEGQNFDIIGVGEIGIGNTLCAAALASVITGIEPERLVGRGSAENKVIQKKADIIARALDTRLPKTDVLDLLARFGGLEIAALVGFIASAPLNRKIIMLDGYVTAVAALLASTINSEVPGCLIVPSTTAEPGHMHVLAQMDLQAVLDLQINYGEGLVATIGLFMIEMVNRFYAYNQTQN